MMYTFAETTKRALARNGDLKTSPFILAMSKEEILRTLPGVYDSGDGNPLRYFPGPSTANRLAARLSRATFYWQIQPIDAVRALAKNGRCITDSHLILWMRGEETLRPSLKRSIAELVRALEQPESEHQVREWWNTTRAYLASELEKYEQREARRRSRACDGVCEPNVAALSKVLKPASCKFKHPWSVKFVKVK